MTSLAQTFSPFKVVLATRNAHKIKEITAIFAETPIQFVTLDEYPGAPDVVEDGKTL